VLLYLEDELLLELLELLELDDELEEAVNACERCLYGAHVHVSSPYVCT
jgi:hypothetical protein